MEYFFSLMGLWAPLLVGLLALQTLQVRQLRHCSYCVWVVCNCLKKMCCNVKSHQVQIVFFDKCFLQTNNLYSADDFQGQQIISEDAVLQLCCISYAYRNKIKH